MLENKTILSLKKYDLDRSQDQNEKTLFTDPNFGNGFGLNLKLHLFCNLFNKRLTRDVRFSNK